ncbi:hypothetical protein SDC9_192281 [bioreactor metagenome]|uniref:Uncharacterized protein n=1 Tax=bioreactor metagenome TaxID=1076179 RepID=A0A645I1J8_9ZZZZ
MQLVTAQKIDHKKQTGRNTLFLFHHLVDLLFGGELRLKFLDLRFFVFDAFLDGLVLLVSDFQRMMDKITLKEQEGHGECNGAQQRKSNHGSGSLGILRLGRRQSRTDQLFSVLKKEYCTSLKGVFPFGPDNILGFNSDPDCFIQSGRRVGRV